MDGELPRDVAADQRVIALIDRYEERVTSDAAREAATTGFTDLAFDEREEVKGLSMSASRGEVLDQIVEEVNEEFGE